MATVVSAVSHFESIVVSGKLEGCRHLAIRQRPMPVQVIEVIDAILQEHANRLAFRLANQSWVNVAASNVGKAADVADDFAKRIGALPGPR